MVYLTVLFALGLIWFLYRTRAGLILRSVGESPESAHALGYPVRAIRLAAVVCGGALCGLAGAYISVIYTPLWVGGHGGRQGLDCAGSDHLRHLAPGTGVAWCLPVRGRDHVAVPSCKVSG